MKATTLALLLCLTACSGAQVTSERCATYSRSAGRALGIAVMACNLTGLFDKEDCEKLRRTVVSAEGTAVAVCGFLPSPS